MAKRGPYGRWSKNELLRAIAAYKNGDYGLNECSRIYGVPKATIKRHTEGKNSIANGIKSLGRPVTFSPEIEKILSEYILELEECSFGLTMKEIRKLAFDVAEKHSLPHSFNKTKKIAGKKWFYAFMRRNPQLSLRKQECMSMAQDSNRENMNHFLDLGEKTVDEFNITANTIVNVDEGFTTMQKSPQKVEDN